jgi:hypothetical protein
LSRNSLTKKFFERYQFVSAFRKKTKRRRPQLVREKKPIRKHIPDRTRTTDENVPQSSGQKVIPIALKMDPKVPNADIPPEKWRIPEAIKNNPRNNRINNFPKFSFSQKLEMPFM